jgi:hypothetical protein
VHVKKISLFNYYCLPAHFKFEFQVIILFSDFWATFREYEHIHTHHEARVTDVNLMPGRMYRFAVKFCAIAICYAPLFSDGVLILANPPNKGQITVEHRNLTQSNRLNETVCIQCIKFQEDFSDPQAFCIVLHIFG